MGEDGSCSLSRGDDYDHVYEEEWGGAELPCVQRAAEGVADGDACLANLELATD